MPEETYWCLSVLTGICGRLLDSEGTYWCLSMPMGV